LQRTQGQVQGRGYGHVVCARIRIVQERMLSL